MHRGSILASHPAAAGSKPSFPKKNSEEKIFMLLRLINSAGQRKVDNGLKIQIKPIQIWLVASQFYKKVDLDPKTVTCAGNDFIVTVLVDCQQQKKLPQAAHHRVDAELLLALVKAGALSTNKKDLLLQPNCFSSPGVFTTQFFCYCQQVSATRV